MRTTVNIQDNLLEVAKEAASRRKCTLGAVLDDSLRYFLLDRKQSLPTKPTPFPTFKGEGTYPGVDISSSSALLDDMEGR